MVSYLVEQDVRARNEELFIELHVGGRVVAEMNFE